MTRLFRRPPAVSERRQLSAIIAAAWPLLHRETQAMRARRVEISDWAALAVERTSPFAVRLARSDKNIHKLFNSLERVTASVGVKIFERGYLGRWMRALVGSELEREVDTPVADHIPVVLMGPGALVVRLSFEILSTSGPKPNVHIVVPDEIPMYTDEDEQKLSSN